MNSLVEAADGYPYFNQEFGKALWDIAPATPFSTEDATLAVATGRSQLDAGFFPSRWERATKSERNYLRSMAEDGDAGSNTGVVAERLGTSQSKLGPARAGLISKGLIYAPSMAKWHSPFLEWQPSSSGSTMPSHSRLASQYLPDDLSCGQTVLLDGVAREAVTPTFVRRLNHNQS